MSVLRFDDPHAFEQRACLWLEKSEALNNLPLGILGILQRRSDLAQKAWMLMAEDSVGHLIAIRTPPQHLVLADTPGALQSIPELVNWLVENASVLEPLSGLVAPAGLAAAFQAAWQVAGQASLELEMEERIYVLTKVQYPAQPAGHYRLAQLGDLGTLLSWVEAFLAEALPNEKHGSEKLRQQTLRQIEAGDLSVWVTGDRLVSMAARTRPTRHGQAISLVYTPPEYRGQGYARACVATLSQALLDQGRQFCCLFTDLSNPASNHIYQQIGYQPIGDVWMLRQVEAIHAQ